MHCHRTTSPAPREQRWSAQAPAPAPALRVEHDARSNARFLDRRVADTEVRLLDQSVAAIPRPALHGRGVELAMQVCRQENRQETKGSGNR